MKEGLIHIYTGEGKGKTTAAMGLVMRAVGQGLKVCIVRFLKEGSKGSGELKLIEDKLPYVDVFNSKLGHPMFYKKKPVPSEYEEECEGLFAICRGKASSGDYDLLVMEEVNNVIAEGWLRWDDVATFLQEKPEGLEVVLTGRDAHPQLQAMADYVTEMLKIKHPYDRGVIARRGIEY